MQCQHLLPSEETASDEQGDADDSLKENLRTKESE
jgi:hypothetical protein